MIQNDSEEEKEREALIKSEDIKEAVQEKPFDSFLPTVSFQFEKPIKDIKYDELQRLLGEEAVILNVTYSPPSLQVALPSNEESEKDTKDIIDKYKANMVETFNSEEGKNIVGKLANEPTVIIPILFRKKVILKMMIYIKLKKQ